MSLVQSAECLRADLLLAARANSSLAGAARSELAMHLGTCAACREVADELTLSDALDDRGALPVVERSTYELGAEVARGGMGRIRAARDLRIGRAVAVKELLVRTPELAARFEREARITARLQHPGIVPIYEIGSWPDGTPFYTMRMVDGRTLADAFAAHATLASRLALLPRVLAAAEAVAFAHARGVIHRDLTPANVLIGDYGETVVIDWGLARVCDEPDGVSPAALEGPRHGPGHLTRLGVVIGTVPYMPPEQARGEVVDERADVYALGAILHHLLAGRAPYSTSGGASVLEAVRREPPPPLELVAPGAPRDLVSIASKAMARDPAARYPTARELAAELARFRDGQLVDAHRYSRLELARRFAHRHRAPLAVGAIALLALIVFAAVSLHRILRSQAEARTTARELLVENGRSELLAGHPARALAYLHEAHRRGGDTPVSWFLVHQAIAAMTTTERTLDCGGAVRGVDFSPDGRNVAAACTDVAVVWNLDDGREITRLRAAAGAFEGIRYAPAGDRLVTWGTDGVARIWASSGALRTELGHGGGSITFASFTPDGAQLATTGFDGRVVIWDTERGARLRAIRASLGPFYGLVAAGGEVLVGQDLSGVGKGWDLATGTLLGSRDHGSTVLGGEVSPDGALAVTCGINRLVKVWDARTGELRHVLGGHADAVWKCVFSPDSSLVLSMAHDGSAAVWRVSDGAMRVSVEHGDLVLSGRFSPDASRFATISVMGRVKVWDARSGALLASHDAGRGVDAKFSPDGERLVVQRGDGRLAIVRGAFGPQRATFVRAERSRTLATTDGGAVAVVERDAGFSSALTLWDIETGRQVAAPALRRPFAIGREIVVARSGDRELAIVEARTGAVRARLAVPGIATEVTVTPDASRISVGYADHGAQVWDVGRGVVVAELAGAHVALDAHGRHALVWGDATPAIWDVEAGRRLSEVRLQPHAELEVVGFAADGRHVVLVVRAADQSARVGRWDVSTGAPVGALVEIAAPPTLDPTGSFLTTIGPHHEISVWRTLDGARLAAFVGENLQHAQVDPSGTRIAAIARQGTIALVTSTDGRVLARWPIAHDPPAITERNVVTVGDARIDWSASGDRLVVNARDVVVLEGAAAPAPRQLAEVIALGVPWRAAAGRLVLARDGRLHGRVVAGSAGLAGATVSVEIRTLPDLGAAPLAWELVRPRSSTQSTRTDGAGAFAIDALVPGDYTITVTDRAGRRRAIAALASATAEAVTIDLADYPIGERR